MLQNTRHESRSFQGELVLAIYGVGNPFARGLRRVRLRRSKERDAFWAVNTGGVQMPPADKFAALVCLLIESIDVDDYFTIHEEERLSTRETWYNSFYCICEISVLYFGILINC